jgi:hypothetical protein
MLLSITPFMLRVIACLNYSAGLSCPNCGIVDPKLWAYIARYQVCLLAARHLCFGQTLIFINKSID